MSKRIKLEKNKIVVVSEPRIKSRPSIGLVLSGGGSRGIAHIGVLKYIEKRHIPIDYIVGTSIGSLVGGLYAAGYTAEEIERFVKKTDWNTLFSDNSERTSLFIQQKKEYDRYLWSIGFRDFKPYIPNALTPGQKLLSIITKMVIKAPYQVKNSFDDLKIPFRAVAADLISGKAVILKDGNLAESINASMVIPLLFSPIERDSLLLVDGGLVDNLPVDPARAMGAEVIVASDMSAALRNRKQLNLPWEVADQVTTIMAKTGYEKNKKDADYFIRPHIPNITNTDFSKIDSLIAAGETAAEQSLAPLLDSLRNRYGNADRYRWKITNAVDLIDNKISRRLCEDDTLSYAAVESALDRLINSGYYKKVEAVLDTSGGGMKLTLDAEKCSILRKINIIGAVSIDSQKIIGKISMPIGQVINMDSLKKSLRRIRELYINNGNTLMEFTEIHIDAERGILTIRINEGLIDNIELVGNKHTKDYVILRDFDGLIDKAFDWREIDTAMRNVYSSGLFVRVAVNVRRNTANYTLVVKVEEKSAIRLKIGGKVGNDRRAQLYLALTDQNVLGNGINATLLGRFGTYDNFYALNLGNDRIFNTYLTVNALGYWGSEINPYYIEDEQRGKYYEKRVGLKLRLGFQLFRLGQIVGEFRMENVSDNLYEGEFDMGQNIELHTISFKSVSDGRNKRAFPTDGGYFYWMFESGSELLLNSQRGYTKAMVHLERYLSLNDRHTWHVRARLGVGDKTLPFSENFRMGGLEDFYGYWKNELFGKQQLLLSAEYRIRMPLVFDETYISMRYDVGGVWQDPTLLLTLSDLQGALGVCIGFNTLLGPLKFAYGRTFMGKEAGYLSFGFNF